MADDVRRQVEDKAEEVQERLAEAGEALRRNVRDGIRSAVKGGDRKFGRPPSGRPPTGRPPSGRPPSIG